MKHLKLVLLLGIMIVSSIAKASVWYPLPVEAYGFGKKYPKAQSLLFAFDYGHALVYERLLLHRGRISNPADFERKILADVMKILQNPPTVKVEEDDIAPSYVDRFPLLLNLFDWSHLLHQFVLDVLATSQDRGPGMILRVNALTDQYQAAKPVAITDTCKTMDFMDGHYFSKAFRENYPSFNQLIWAYHWFQIRLYEDLLLPTEIERDAAVAATTEEFFELLSDLPDSAGFEMMPETAVEAPTFAKNFPKLPPAFDNNHMLHDIVSDLLVSSVVPFEALRREGIRMGRMALDPDAFRATTCGHGGGHGGTHGGGAGGQ
ncbi:MAG: hypothetical protein ACLGG0_08000 [Bacteriovoracia bacterium]